MLSQLRYLITKLRISPAATYSVTATPLTPRDRIPPDEGNRH